jgi:DNA-binding transcriptional ArsR family regulator
VDVFAALADPTRRHLVERLARDPDGSLTELSADLPVSRQAVTKHLQALQAAGLVTSERRGRETRYRLQPGALRPASAWIDQVGLQWDDRLGRLRRLAEARSG